MSSKLKLSLLWLLVILGVATSLPDVPSYYHPSVYPIVWSKTDLKVKSSLRYLTIDIEPFYPCTTVASMLTSQSSGWARLFEERCNVSYAKVQTIIDQNCEWVFKLKIGKPDRNQERRKRSFIELGVILGDSFSTIVVIIQNTVKVFQEIKQYFKRDNDETSSPSDSPDYLEILSDSHSTDDLDDLERKFNSTLSAYQTKIQSELSSIHLKLHSLGAYVHFEGRELESIRVTKRILQHFLPLFKAGIFKPHQLEQLIAKNYNLSSICSNCSSPSTWKPLVCQRTSTGHLVLQLRADEIDEQRMIVQATPFRVVTRSNRNLFEKKKSCFYKYTGPEYVHYDRDTDCTNEIVPPSTANRASFFLPKFVNCSTAISLASKLHYWTETHCLNVSQLTAHSVVQVHSDGHANCIYCFGFNVTIPAYHERFTCANVVYRIDKKAEVFLEKTDGSRVKLMTERDRDRADFINSDIGELISTRLGVPSIRKIEERQGKEQSKDEKWGSIGVYFMGNQLFYWLTLVAIALFAGILFFSTRKLYKTVNWRRNGVNREQTQLSSQIVDSLSYANPMFAKK